MIGLPRSLRGRTLLLTVAGIFACEAVTFAVLGIYRHNLLAGRARDFVTGQIEMVRSALAHATPEQVAEELDRPPRQRIRGLLVPRDRTGGPGEAARARGGADLPDDEPPPGAPPREEGPTTTPSDDTLATSARDEATTTPRDGAANGASRDDAFAARRRPGAPSRGFGRMHLVAALPPDATDTVPADLPLPQVVASLRDEYGADALRFTDAPEPAVWVHMPPDRGWLMVPFSRYSSPPIPWSILLATFAAVSLMGGLVGLYVFRLALPLRALADAAARFRIGQHPALPLTGPDEVRAVTTQFNAMAERLERDDAERRMMLAGLPHDLRAPLSRAKLRLELMDDGPDSPKQGLQRDLAEVGRIADQFVAYLRGLDHDASGFRPVALQEIVRDRGLVWRESGHDVTIERADPCTRAADADGLTRAVDNLIANAFAHGQSPVTISGVADPAGASYRIVVGDRGPGIPASQRDEALRPFTRLDAARGASGHCGLGLAVVQSIARLHGGQVALDERPGGGLAAAIVVPSR